MKPGYKQTEVGLIPEDWEVRKFTDVTSLITCGIAATPDYVHENIGRPFLSSSNVKDGRIVWSGYKHISEALHRQLYRNNPPKKGDILYSRVGTFGEAAVVDVDFEFSVYVSLTLIKPDWQLESKYLMQLLNSDAYKRRAKDQIYLGGGVGNLNVDVVRRYPIVVPLLPEQRAIAEALSDVDGLLGALDRLIAKKRDIKQATIQQLLTGQIRLQGFHGEWEVKALENFISNDRFAVVDGPFGSQLRVDEYVASGVSVIEMEHLCDKYITERIGRCITSRKFEDLKRSAVYPGDLIISKTGSLGKLGMIPDSLKRGLITSRLAKITIDPAKADLQFVFQCLLKLRSDGYWEKVSQGGTMQILGIGMLKSAPLPSISVAEQAAIAQILSDMDTELAALEQRRDKTRALKQGMMQELLTGRTRLVLALSKQV